MPQLTSAGVRSPTPFLELDAIVTSLDNSKFLNESMLSKNNRERLLTPDAGEDVSSSMLATICNGGDARFLTKQDETEFWAQILHAIGSHMLQVNPTHDKLSKIVCGYWILWIIANIQQGPHQHKSIPKSAI